MAGPEQTHPAHAHGFRLRSFRRVQGSRNPGARFDWTRWEGEAVLGRGGLKGDDPRGFRLLAKKVTNFKLATVWRCQYGTAKMIRRLAPKWDTSSPFGNVTVPVTALIPFFSNG